MENYIQDLINEAKKNRRLANDLKHSAVRAKLYEVAAMIRDLEKNSFPSDGRDIQGQEFSLALRMAEIDTTDPMAWKILSVAKVFLKKKGKFSLEDAAKISAESIEIFGE